MHKVSGATMLLVETLLEETFGIDFSDVYFDQTNFDSVELISDFVRENKPS